MTDALVVRLQALIEQWRAEAVKMRGDIATYPENVVRLDESAGTCEACADELSAVVREAKQQPEPIIIDHNHVGVREVIVRDPIAARRALVVRARDQTEWLRESGHGDIAKILICLCDAVEALEAAVVREAPQEGKDPLVAMTAERDHLYRRLCKVGKILQVRPGQTTTERAEELMFFSPVVREAETPTPDPLQGIRDAKYLNPVCSVDGCQWLVREAVSVPAPQEETNASTSCSVMPTAVSEVRPVLLAHPEQRSAMQTKPETSSQSVEGVQGLAAPQDWQPIETAGTGEYVLVALPPKGLVTIAVRNIVDEWYAWLPAMGVCSVNPPTHWLPLPAPPQEQKQEDFTRGGNKLLKDEPQHLDTIIVDEPNTRIWPVIKCDQPLEISDCPVQTSPSVATPQEEQRMARCPHCGLHCGHLVPTSANVMNYNALTLMNR